LGSDKENLELNWITKILFWVQKIFYQNNRLKQLLSLCRLTLSHKQNDFKIFWISSLINFFFMIFLWPDRTPLQSASVLVQVARQTEKRQKKNGSQRNKLNFSLTNMNRFFSILANNRELLSAVLLHQTTICKSL
jgi:hypothetical protein